MERELAVAHERIATLESQLSLATWARGDRPSKVTVFVLAAVVGTLALIGTRLWNLDAENRRLRSEVDRVTERLTWTEDALHCANSGRPACDGSKRDDASAAPDDGVE